MRSIRRHAQIIGIFMAMTMLLISTPYQSALAALIDTGTVLDENQSQEARDYIKQILAREDVRLASSLPDLVNLINQGYDLAGTSRISKGKPENMPLSNYLANKTFNLIASLVFLRRIKDVHTGMRAYRRSMLQAIDWQVNGSALPVELILMPLRKKYKITEIPIEYHPRIGETTLDKWNSTLWTLRRIFRCRF